MSCRKQLQSSLPAAFLVLAGEMPESFPDRRLDDGHRDRAQRDRRFDRADRTAVFETRLTRLASASPARVQSSAADGVVPIDEVADGGDIDAFFGAGANDRNVDAFDQRRGGPVVNLDDSQSAADARIDA